MSLILKVGLQGYTRLQERKLNHALSSSTLENNYISSYIGF